MQRAAIGEVALEYEVAGSGDPVVLMHAGVCAGFFRPLRREPALADHFRLLRYRRVGYAGSGRLHGSVDFAGQAAHCRAVISRAARAGGAGAFEQAVADADTFFAQERPAVIAWRFGPDEAARVRCPVLLIRGELSEPFFAERVELLRDWLPQADVHVVPGATHLLPAQQPRLVAEALAGFFATHRADSTAPAG